MTRSKIIGPALYTLGIMSLLTACAQQPSPPQAAAISGPPLMTSQSAAGRILTTPAGMTVYTFDMDTIGRSNCYNACAVAWPPVLASAGQQPAGDLSVNARSDGTMQWAQHGMPLYTFSYDKHLGDMKGDNYDTTWHIAR
jgi:predicted lipoprotein with Yx(FWY)xxD motif